jgi:hypothetical protein
VFQRETNTRVFLRVTALTPRGGARTVVNSLTHKTAVLFTELVRCLSHFHCKYVSTNLITNSASKCVFYCISN